MSLTAQLTSIWTQVHSPTSLPFPTTVAQLQALGVVRYHIDYVSHTATNYVSTPGSAIQSHVSALPSSAVLPPLSDVEFNQEALIAAIRKAQAMATNGRSDYLGFAKACVQAGVTDYVAFLTGRKVLYLGAKGETHTEWFPGAGPGDQ